MVRGGGSMWDAYSVCMIHARSLQPMHVLELFRTLKKCPGKIAGTETRKASWEHLDDDLHVLVQCEDEPNRVYLKLKTAVEQIKKLLVPAREGEDDLKRKQLTELAILNGTYRPVKQQILILVRCLHAIFISPLGSPITQASSVPTANSFVQFHLSSGKSDHTGEQCTYGELFRAVTQHRLQCANEPFVFGCCSPDIFVDGEWRLPAIVVKVPGGHLAHQRCSSVKGAAVISSRSDPHYATGVYWLGLTLEVP